MRNLQRIHFLLLGACMAVVPLLARAADEYENGGCLPIASLNASLATHSGQLVFALWGTSMWARTDAEYRFSMTRYFDGDKMNLLFLQRGLPELADPQDVCVWFRAASGKGAFRNPAIGKPEAQSILNPINDQTARKECPELIGQFQQAYDRRLTRLGDKWINGGDALRALAKINGHEPADETEKDRKVRQDSLKGGSNVCDSFNSIAARQRAEGRKLVAMIPATELRRSKEGGALGSTVLAFFLPARPDAGWTVYSVGDAGQALLMAAGSKLFLAEGVFKD